MNERKAKKMCGKRGRLINEFERLVERIWRCDKTEPAFTVCASDFYDLVRRAGVLVTSVKVWNDFASLAVLKANRAKKPGRFARLRGLCAKRENGRLADSDAPICASAVDLSAKRFNLLHLNDIFAFEFIKLVIECVDMGFKRGEFFFSVSHIFAAKKLAEPLKWFAARIDKLEDGDDGINVHRLIAEYKNRREVAKNAGDYTT